MIEDALTLVWNSIFVQSSLLYRATSCPYLSWRLLWRPQEQTKKAIEYKWLKIKLKLTCGGRSFQAFAGNQVNQTHSYFYCILLCLSKRFDVKKTNKKNSPIVFQFQLESCDVSCSLEEPGGDSFSQYSVTSYHVCLDMLQSQHLTSHTVTGDSEGLKHPLHTTL